MKATQLWKRGGKKWKSYQRASSRRSRTATRRYMKTRNPKLIKYI